VSAMDAVCVQERVMTFSPYLVYGFALNHFRCTCASR